MSREYQIFPQTANCLMVVGPSCPSGYRVYDADHLKAVASATALCNAMQEAWDAGLRHGLDMTKKTEAA